MEINKILKQSFWKSKWTENESLGRQHLVVPVSLMQMLKMLLYWSCHLFRRLPAHAVHILKLCWSTQDYWRSAHCVQGVTATGLSPLRDPQFRVLSSMSKENRGQTVTDGCTFQDQQRKDTIAPVPEPITERHAPSPQCVETHSPTRGDIVFHWERSLGHCHTDVIF